ncbi:hypothetical protein EAH_00048080 [Eimeria acervulina]|uniref:YTH domain-containing protein n=1 Tax=Eimeria acervulina TaxID=5801 RepID=U6H004_EIMAC|nr:hypothetical protein EAH_00048080 [Eimeria acervulina]CDI84074.1 hypothetical protein EAH_00048080 [Eimeria acervulina]
MIQGSSGLGGPPSLGASAGVLGADMEGLYSDMQQQQQQQQQGGVLSSHPAEDPATEFFIIRSCSEYNVQVAMQMSVWATIPRNEARLSQAVRVSRAAACYGWWGCSLGDAADAPAAAAAAAADPAAAKAAENAAAEAAANAAAEAAANAAAEAALAAADADAAAAALCCVVVEAPHVLLFFRVQGAQCWAGYARMRNAPGEGSKPSSVFSGRSGRPFVGLSFDVDWLSNSKMFVLFLFAAFAAVYVHRMQDPTERR